MGLYINNSHHPDVFKNKDPLREPNQIYSRQDFLTELMSEQLKANAALKKAFTDLRQETIQQEEIQVNQWNTVEHQLQDLRKSNVQQQEVENQIFEMMQVLQQENIQLQTILEKEALVKQEMIDEVNHLRKSYEEIVNRLDQNETANQQLSLQMNEQIQLQKETVENLNKQEVLQTDVLTRLDSQEALVEKISRQLLQIRSILFERTNYLATKIEDGYKLTSSYVYKLMTGSDKPLTFYLMNQRQEENEKRSD